MIGRTAQLDQTTKKNTFELFRRNVVNPEILTFDELFERAKFIVEDTAEKEPSGAQGLAGEDSSAQDDVPF